MRLSCCPGGEPAGDGQMAGPLLSASLSGSAQGFGGLFIALAVGAAALLASAWWLVRAR
jgi:hypothetical protein